MTLNIWEVAIFVVVFVHAVQLGMLLQKVGK